MSWDVPTIERCSDDLVHNHYLHKLRMHLRMFAWLARWYVEAQHRAGILICMIFLTLTTSEGCK